MSIRLFQTIGGFFVLNDSKEILKYVSFPSKSEIIAEKLFVLQEYHDSPEVEELLDLLKEDEVVTNSSELTELLRKKGLKSEVDANDAIYKNFSNDLPRLLKEYNFIHKEQEYWELLRETTIALVKKQIAHSSQRIDKMVVHAILSVDDIDKTTNLFISRLREWYGIHFPEILKHVENHATFCKLITEVGIRDNFTVEKLKKYGFSESKCSELVKLAKNSMGATYGPNDLAPLQQLAQRTLDLFQQREALVKWIEQQMDRIAPNMKAVVGSAIAARLIAIAGGLEELAKMPASTIQLLGAEKALFRALKTGAKPPKHGIIYQMPELHSCPWWQRGNMARAIAGKLAIAARVDAFQGEFVGEELRKDLERKFEEIRIKYKNPPEGKKPPKEYPPHQEKKKGKKPSKRAKKGQKSKYRSKKKR